jgi:hypothetical protein
MFSRLRRRDRSTTPVEAVSAATQSRDIQIPA